MKKEFRYKTKEYLQKCLDEEKSIHKIAKENNVYWTTVYRYVKEYGLRFPKSREKKFPEPKNRIGQKTGIITIIECIGYRAHHQKAKKIIYYKYKCDCGREGEIAASLIPFQFSCGCLKNKYLGVNFINENIERKDLKSFNQLYASYRTGALKRLLEFNLTKQQFANLIDKNCNYCGIKPSSILKSTHKKHLDCIYNGIDRVDNNKGYIVDNCITCCTICNKAKRNLTIEEFSSWINRLIKHNEKR